MPPLDKEILDDLKAKVAEYQAAVVSIFATPGKYGFSYTVGLAGRDLPELVMFGVHPEIATPVLMMLARRMITGQRAFDHGDRPDTGSREAPWIYPATEDVVAECLLLAKHVTDKPVTALVVAVPDNSGRSPLDPDCDAPYSDQVRFIKRLN
jgi:hypothetical protein